MSYQVNSLLKSYSLYWQIHLSHDRLGTPKSIITILSRCPRYAILRAHLLEHQRVSYRPAKSKNKIDPHSTITFHINEVVSSFYKLFTLVINGSFKISLSYSSPIVSVIPTNHDSIKRLPLM